MRVVDTLAPLATTQSEPSFVSNCPPHFAHKDELVSLSSRKHFTPLEPLIQLVEIGAMTLFFPFFIYTGIVLTSMSLIFVPFIILSIPFLIAHQVVRGIFHTLFPCFFYRDY